MSTWSVPSTSLNGPTLSNDPDLPPSNPLIRKLEQFTEFSREDKRALDALGREANRHVPARMDILRQGDRPTFVSLILSGWACRYKMLADGRRQILAFLLPGDLCDLNVTILRRMDHSIGAITPVTLAEVPRDSLNRIMAGQPRVRSALWWEQLVVLAIQREWTVSLGQRSAFERVAHLLCELLARLSAVGLTEGGRCEMPLTQTELADAVGLTLVHANRMLQELRSQGLIQLRKRELTVPDVRALQAAAQFDPSYLHLDHEGGQHDAGAMA